MNRQGELSPTLYYPVLGQEGSEKQAETPSGSDSASA